MAYPQPLSVHSGAVGAGGGVSVGAPDHGAGHYRALPQYPATSRDVAFLAPAELEHAAILDFVRRCKLPDLESVQLFDVFVDDKLRAAGKKSMAYEFVFRNAARTLTDAEVNERIEKLRGRLAAELKLELR